MNDGFRRNAGLLLLFWVALLVLWPTPINVRLGERTTIGEGLYKSDLTQAGFGLSGVRFYESYGGRKNWAIRTEFAELNRQKENYAFMRPVDADFFGSQTGNVVHTTSQYGRSHFDSHRVELEGDVVILSEHGYRFRMEHLDYDSVKHHFRSTDPVRMEGPDLHKPDMLLTGTGLEGDLDSEVFRIKRATRARRRLSNDSWIRIQSVSGQFHPTSNRAVFTERVKAYLPSMVLESDQLEMDIGDITNELLKAKGNVVLWHKNRRGNSERADIEIGNDKVVLEGKASIVGEDNELRGQRITLYTDGDLIEVDSAEGSM